MTWILEFEPGRASLHGIRHGQPLSAFSWDAHVWYAIDVWSFGSRTWRAA